MDREKDLGSTMRELEYFHSLRLLPHTWTIVRVDGRGFSRFTDKNNFKKPYDENFRDWMTTTATYLMKELHAVYAYTQSDEISVLLNPFFDLFDREIEKLVSISASAATAGFLLAMNKNIPVHFDSRIISLPTEDLVKSYFLWRQEDAGRNCINSHVYWHMRQNGSNKKDATMAMSHKDFAWLNEYLFNLGINFSQLPAWQRRGIGVIRKITEKLGWNPKKQIKESFLRRTIEPDFELPMNEEYKKYISDRMAE